MSVLFLCIQVHGPASQHVNNSTMTVTTPNPSALSRGYSIEDHRDEYRKEALRKGKCLSIGIQVNTRLQKHGSHHVKFFSCVLFILKNKINCQRSVYSELVKGCACLLLCWFKVFSNIFLQNITKRTNY